MGAGGVKERTGSRHPIRKWAQWVSTNLDLNLSVKEWERGGVGAWGLWTLWTLWTLGTRGREGAVDAGRLWMPGGGDA
jgi:hypothetical protein